MAVLVFLTLPFWFSTLDIAFQSLFFQQGWYLDDNPIVRLLYRWGTLPGLVLACGALALLVRNRNGERQREWRRAAAALLLTLFLGPGLLINGISKKYTGRPRPREIVTFGGNWEYRHVMDFGVPGRGHSFPAGHPSTGFLLFSLYYSFRSHHPRRARTWLAAGALYGGVMGVGRIVQGAHFLSDVIWSGGMTLLMARIAHAWTGGDQPGVAWNRLGRGLGRTTRMVTGLVVLGVLVLGILAATPFNLNSRLPLSGTRALVLDLDSAHVRIFSGKESKIRVDARGFAPPFSQCRLVWGGITSDRVLKIRRSGFFFELNVDVQITLGADFDGDLLVRCGRGDISVKKGVSAGRILLETGDGKLSWSGDGSCREVLLRSRRGDIQVTTSNLPKQLVVTAQLGVAGLFRDLQQGGLMLEPAAGVAPTWFVRQADERAVVVSAPSIRFL